MKKKIYPYKTCKHGRWYITSSHTPEILWCGKCGSNYGLIISNRTYNILVEMWWKNMKGEI